jgi:6-phosphogluconolactonase
MRLFIGTYTDGAPFFSGACGEGIMTCLFDFQNGSFSRPKQCADLLNPSWLRLVDDRRYLFAVSERFEQPGAVYGFEVDADGGLAQVSSQSSQGLATCHLAMSETHLYAASYLDGKLSVHARKGAKIQVAQNVIEFYGAGPNLERQEGAHAHQAVVSPNGRWLYVCDLGSDCIRSHALHEGVPVHTQDIDVEPGVGPRHLVFHPTKPLVWCVCELIPKILTFAWDAKTGSLELLHNFNMADFSEFEGTGAAAAIHLHPSGQLLGISDRAAHSICLCAVAESGELTFQHRIQNEEQTPRDFVFTPDGHWLIAAYQDTHCLLSFAISENLRVSLAPANRLEVNSPVCIVI